MKVQRILIPGTDRVTWLVLGDDYLAVPPIQQYFTYLENIERSPLTIRAYAYHLCLYWQYLKGSKLDWTTIGLSELAEFVAWLRQPLPGVISLQEQEAKRSEATINAILAAVCMFYDYHERMGVITRNAFYRNQVQPYRKYKSFLHHINKSKPARTRLVKLHTTKRIPETLMPEQVKELIDACTRLRDKFLISLLYQTGVRVGQALGLRHEDIRSWDNEIHIVPRNDNSNGARAKAREPYVLHVTTDLMAQYTDYLIQEFDETDSSYVFVNLWEGAIGQPMTYETVIALFRRLRRKTGIAVHPHMLRHTHATELLRSGMEPMYVQKRLGHASIQTTLSTYSHLDTNDLKAAYHGYLDKRKK